MSECKAFGCKHNKRDNKDKHFFCVPKPTNPERSNLALQWLHNIGTGHSLSSFPFGANGVVCQDHFESKAYLYSDIHNRFYGTPRSTPRSTSRLRLKPDAVPTIFMHKPAPDSDKARRVENRVTQQNSQVCGVFWDWV